MPTILAIDRHDGWLDRHRARLEKSGYAVEQVPTVKGALRSLRQNGYDVVIFDKSVTNGAEGKTFQTAVQSMAKLVVASDGRFQGLARWLRGGRARYVYGDCDSRELLYAVRELERLTLLAGDRNRLDEELRRRSREFDSLHAFGQELASTLELDRIIRLVTSRARKLTGAGAAYLLLAEEESGRLQCRRVAGGCRKDVERLGFGEGHGVAGWAAANRASVVVLNVGADDRFNLAPGMARHYSGRHVVAMPILSEAGVLGVLEVLGKKGDRFGDRAVETFRKLADQAALALERAMLYQKTAEMAITDDLTKLFNLRYLSSVIEAEIDRAQRYGTGVSLIFMDLDHFKDVNDNYGHLVGSKVLVEVAQLLLRSLRSVDIVARYGGDEFVVVLPQTPMHEAVVIAERIRRSLQKATYLKREGINIRLTASFGVTAYPEACRSKDDLLRLADEAMYMAKASNRNTVYTMRS